MDFVKGGRGHKAPYSTTHLRVPEPLKEELEAVIQEFKEKVAKGEIVINGKKIFLQISLPTVEDERVRKLKALLNKYEHELTPDRITQPRWKNVYKLVNEIKSILE
jgi:hypothetical protein